ncbi:MAG: MoxR family ATPase [Myxococcales bacterium]
MSSQPEADVANLVADLAQLRSLVQKRIVGQADVLDGVLTCLLCGGHALLEGVPGLGKTLLVRTLADATSLSFARIQFTPDLMPADILGTTVLSETAGGARSFAFQRGPIFANVVLADEVNRATPKTQSALLEVMQEHSVTVGTTTHRLEEPYCVLATQNPLEMEGTYPLPEAQLDRFLLKLEVTFPSHDELHAILDRTTGQDEAPLGSVLSRERILAMRRVVREVAVPRHVQEHAVNLLEATHPGRKPGLPRVERFVRFGASPRGAQAMLLAAKARAVFDGRFSVSPDDVRAAARPALRHRIILSFEGEAEGIRTDHVLDDILATIRIP